jgi:hypothetical protein
MEIGATPIFFEFNACLFQIGFHFPHTRKHFANENEISRIGVTWFEPM